jgi:hypothetical protein
VFLCEVDSPLVSAGGSPVISTGAPLPLSRLERPSLVISTEAKRNGEMTFGMAFVTSNTLRILFPEPGEVFELAVWTL